MTLRISPDYTLSPSDFSWKLKKPRRRVACLLACADRISGFVNARPGRRWLYIPRKRARAQSFGARVRVQKCNREIVSTAPFYDLFLRSRTRFCLEWHYEKLWDWKKSHNARLGCMNKAFSSFTQLLILYGTLRAGCRWGYKNILYTSYPNAVTFICRVCDMIEESCAFESERPFQFKLAELFRVSWCACELLRTFEDRW